MTLASPDFRPAGIALFGAIHVDIVAHARSVIRRETSTPARFSHYPGGVAANVARALRLLDTPCALVGAIGKDSDGRALEMRLSDEGIDLSGVVKCDLATGRYLALHDPDGSLAAAAVDDTITDSLAADAFHPLGPAAEKAGIWFVEANLPIPLLAQLLQSSAGKLIVTDAVSVAKASRLKSLLPLIDMLFCNRAEAATLLGTEVDSDVARLAEGLIAAGVKSCCVTNGAGQLGFCDASGSSLIHPFKVVPVDVTGAGDALIAGWLAERMKGSSPREALRTGLAAAAITLEAAGSAPDGLNWPEIDRRLAEADASLDATS